MKLARTRAGNGGEKLIPLVNIVFLILIFFIYAGTLAPPLDERVDAPELPDVRAVPPETDMLQITSSGELLWHGRPVSEAELVQTLAMERRTKLKIMADRNCAARDLVKLTNALRAGGIADIRIVTARENAR